MGPSRSAISTRASRMRSPRSRSECGSSTALRRRFRFRTASGSSSSFAPIRSPLRATARGSMPRASRRLPPTSRASPRTRRSIRSPASRRSASTARSPLPPGKTPRRPSTSRGQVVNAPHPTNLVFHDRGTFEARSFWQRQLFPPPPRSGLRSDFRSEKPARLSIEDIALTAETRDNLLRITRDSELLVQAVLSAAAAVVLSRYNDLPATVLGCGAGEGNGRTLLPVVLTVDATQSFKALLLRARQSILDARAHGDYPWHTLLSADEAPTASSPWSVGVS